MKREYKILLLIFGSLFGLLALAVVALAFTLAHYRPLLAAAAPLDPIVAKRTAEKIATFDIPRGYRIAQATDLNITQIVTLEPAKRTAGVFSIQLQGSTVPSRSDAVSAGMKAGMALAGRFLNCNPDDSGVDDVVVRGVNVKLTVFQCDGPRMKARIETGVFPGNAGEATITASGAMGDFDTKALHELLRSVR